MIMEDRQQERSYPPFTWEEPLSQVGAGEVANITRLCEKRSPSCWRGHWYSSCPPLMGAVILGKRHGTALGKERLWCQVWCPRLTQWLWEMSPHLTSLSKQWGCIWGPDFAIFREQIFGSVGYSKIQSEGIDAETSEITRVRCWDLWMGDCACLSCFVASAVREWQGWMEGYWC